MPTAITTRVDEVAEDVRDAGAHALRMLGAAGSAIMGKVGIDQTTPGSTNAVELAMQLVGAHTQIAAGSANTVQSLTAPAGAYGLLIQCFIQNLRYTLDGTAATTALGFRLTAGDNPTRIPVVPAQVVKIISETAGAAVEYQWTK